MQVHRNPDRLPSFKNAVLTIGTFDGVHTGHKKIIEQLKEEAKLINGETALITFHPHPRKVLGSKEPVFLINTLEEKIELLGNQGIDHLVIVPFTKQFSELSAEAYIADFLVGKFHPHTVIIGYDHHFGHDRKGNYKMMESFAGKLHFRLKEIPEHIIDSVVVSSTKIREAISTGNIDVANDLLGYEFFFSGIVIEGNKLGRQLGFPTANLKINDPEKLIPGHGIYTVEASIDSKKLKGMMSIGIRPTIGDNKEMIEINLFEFNNDIYGEMMRVHVKHFLRPELKFANLDELKKQIELDKEQTINFFKHRG